MTDGLHLASGQVGSFRFDAGSLSLNLVATVGRRFGEPVERLTSVERLWDWLGGVGIHVSPAPTDVDLARVRRLREKLDELFRNVLAGTRPRPAVLTQVNTAAATRVPQLRTTHAGVVLAQSESGAQALDPVIALIAADAIRIVAGSDRMNLRVCEADDCRMLYLAHGRRARRWCSSEHCGNRSRVAAYRARTGGIQRR
jgi:predicted RNA-binding Zn ribbon-like protein